MKISVIIPTYNEANNIAKLITHLRQASPLPHEIIVSDGGSSDDTICIAEECSAITYTSPVKGRAGQMNYGVNKATGNIYYFVHADTIPPVSYMQDINQAISEGYNCGSYTTKFDSNKFMLRINEWFTTLNALFVRGGDQSIFVTKELYNKIGGFKEDMLIMEDYDFIQQLQAEGKFKVIKKGTLVSARKYDNNTWLEVQLANLKVVRMYKKGASQKAMLETYKRMLNYRDNAF